MRSPEKNPCERHGCHKCCIHLKVPLMQDDVDRIVGLGYKDGQFYEWKGEYRLISRPKGKCYFLLKGEGCGIYPFHPLWCKLYPLTTDVKTGEARIDGLCPHSGEFPVTDEMTLMLATFYEKLIETAKARRNAPATKTG